MHEDQDIGTPKEAGYLKKGFSVTVERTVCFVEGLQKEIISDNSKQVPSESILSMKHQDSS